MKFATTIKNTFAVLLVLLSLGLSAQVSDLTISIQGTLKDAAGISVEDGQRELTFRLYNDITAPLADAVWTETAQVTVAGGIYSHNLGSEEELVAGDFNTTLWLGVTVEGIELTPRTQMTYAPYALAVNSTQQIARQGCSGQVGDIKYSILNPAQFAQENGECWVPMDGRAIPGTRLAGIIGANVPDMSGLFLRATEYNDGNDPGRSPMADATVQDDENKEHEHGINLTTSETPNHRHSVQDRFDSDFNSGYDGNWTFGDPNVNSNTEEDGDDSDSRYGRGYRNIITGSAGAHSHTVNGNSALSGAEETRPKNMNFFIYIRVD